jgi:hypothetical protein
MDDAALTGLQRLALMPRAFRSSALHRLYKFQDGVVAKFGVHDSVID